MNRVIFGLIVFVTSSCIASNAMSKELIREFKGTGNRTTAEFEVKAPWIVDWRTNGDYPGSMAMQLSLVRSPSGEFLGKIATTKWVDNGVKLFNESGRYRLQVNSSLVRWTLRVEQLSRVEAEGYTPKKKKRLQ